MHFVRSALVRSALSMGRRKRFRTEYRRIIVSRSDFYFSTLNHPVTESTSDAPMRLRKGLSVYDRGVEDWRQWYSAAEYINPWDTAFREAPLDFAKQYDYMTQHVMSLLQSFHLFDANSVTTEICNVLLHKLLELLPATSTTSSSSNGEGTTLSLEETVSRSTRVAARALAVLQSMEWIERETVLQQHQQQHNSSHSPRIPRAVPKPNRETYNTLLHIYSRTPGPPHIARTAQILVEKMEQRYTQQHELDMKVTNFHWNSVLLAWSLCTDPNRIVWATQLLLRNAARPQVGPEIVDASSYIHVLRLCARIGQSGANPQQWAKLGAHVAVQLWQEMFERDALLKRYEDHDDRPLSPQRRSLLTEHWTEAELRSPLYIPDLPPHFYNHFLQAIRFLPKGALRDEYFTKCLERASSEGVVNPFVLREFFVHAQSPAVWNQFLGPYRTQIYGMAPDVAVATLMQLLPPEWSARVNAASHGRPSDASVGGSL
jgi:hypothetical protein